MLDRHQQILQQILPLNYSILCFQEVWKDEVRQNLTISLSKDFPFMMEKAFGNGPSKDSGLFLASKFPILSQSFEEYTAGQSGTPDILADKGVFAALLR